MKLTIRSIKKHLDYLVFLATSTWGLLLLLRLGCLCLSSRCLCLGLARGMRLHHHLCHQWILLMGLLHHLLHEGIHSHIPGVSSMNACSSLLIHHLLLLLLHSNEGVYLLLVWCAKLYMGYLYMWLLHHRILRIVLAIS